MQSNWRLGIGECLHEQWFQTALGEGTFALMTADAACCIQECRIWLGDKTLSLNGPLTLTAGRVYLVRGPSGSGKSSFLRALLGLGALTSPPIRVRAHAHLIDREGRSHTIWAGRRYLPASRRHIAFLPQAEKLGFIDGLSTLENLRLYSRLSRDAAADAAGGLAQQFRLAMVPPAVTTASGGERMRLSAIRALMPRSLRSRPPLLVLADEPVSGLDHESALSLAHTLIEVAHRQQAVVIVVTHETRAFLSSAAQPPDESSDEITITAHAIAEDGLLATGEQLGGLILTLAAPRSKAHPRSRRRFQFWDGWQEGLQLLGAAVLAPLALVWGMLRLRKIWYVLGQILRDGTGIGTQLFALTCCTILAATASIFIFQQMPRSELIEPLLLPELLAVTGQTLIRVVLPLGAACFVVGKLGAAQAAGLSAGVRGGLLETLALARWPVEAFGLVPAVLGQIVALTLATLMGTCLGVLIAGLIYVGSHPGASLGLAMSLMTQGCLRDPVLHRFLLMKVIGSGVIGGVAASLFGLCPVSNEYDVGKAVHRTLLWGILGVIAYQCGLIVLEYS
ncbi:MAG: ATP-binding cassette domain-containing protein [Verrucomicrobiota bacterium]|nr:ATP-binding cassette domain-containing protein [Verrucomicrobiota bacterium]MDI9385331.1 ATP-binding cassette domain-containing protein [Verrucomicrobiota bacterium]